jgi:hypothetical protein
MLADITPPVNNKTVPATINRLMYRIFIPAGITGNSG